MEIFGVKAEEFGDRGRWRQMEAEKGNRTKRRRRI